MFQKSWLKIPEKGDVTRVLVALESFMFPMYLVVLLLVLLCNFAQFLRVFDLCHRPFTQKLGESARLFEQLVECEIKRRVARPRFTPIHHSRRVSLNANDMISENILSQDSNSSGEDSELNS